MKEINMFVVLLASTVKIGQESSLLPNQKVILHKMHNAANVQSGFN